MNSGLQVAISFYMKANSILNLLNGLLLFILLAVLSPNLALASNDPPEPATATLNYCRMALEPASYINRFSHYLPPWMHAFVYSGVNGPVLLLNQKVTAENANSYFARLQSDILTLRENYLKNNGVPLNREVEIAVNELELLNYLVARAKSTTYNSKFFAKYSEAPRSVEIAVDERIQTGEYHITPITPSDTWAFKTMDSMKRLGFVLKAKPGPEQKFRNLTEIDVDRGDVTDITSEQLRTFDKSKLIYRIYYRDRLKLTGRWYWPHLLDQNLWLPFINFSQEMIDTLLTSEQQLGIDEILKKMRELHRIHFPSEPQQ